MNFKILQARAQFNEYILLCHLPDNSVTPYVTWRSGDISGSNCYSGNYNRNLKSAELDFKERLY
jgi:hypothetical protein